jgi:hypothetical protein
VLGCFCYFTLARSQNQLLHSILDHLGWGDVADAVLEDSFDFLVQYGSVQQPGFGEAPADQGWAGSLGALRYALTKLLSSVGSACQNDSAVQNNPCSKCITVPPLRVRNVTITSCVERL